MSRQANPRVRKSSPKGVPSGPAAAGGSQRQDHACEGQAGLLHPKIDDWRAMVDCVMIDPAYDGKVFSVALSDVPERKSDLVTGKYEFAAPKDKTTIAVKITDMLGEEILTLHTV